MSLLTVSGLLLGLLLVGTGMTRSRTGSAPCLATLGQMVRAWQLYALDHQEAFPDKGGIAEGQNEITRGTFRNWVNNAMT